MQDGKGPFHTAVVLLFSAADGSSSKQATDVAHMRERQVDRGRDRQIQRETGRDGA